MESHRDKSKVPMTPQISVRFETKEDLRRMAGWDGVTVGEYTDRMITEALDEEVTVC